MNNIVLATSNKNKVIEINQIINGKIEFIGLDFLGYKGEIPEDQSTLEGNAFQKSNYIFQIFGIPTLAEDTGLFVKSLDGDPGVYTARYASKNHSELSNIDFLLKNMNDIIDRSAFFKTVFCLITKNKTLYFEGKCNGTISIEPKGTAGFGYDPVFIPNGYTESFAELNYKIKNKIGHRGLALEKLIEYLEVGSLLK